LRTDETYKSAQEFLEKMDAGHFDARLTDELKKTVPGATTAADQHPHRAGQKTPVVTVLGWPISLCNVEALDNISISGKASPSECFV